MASLQGRQGAEQGNVSDVPRVDDSTQTDGGAMLLCVETP